LDSLDQIVALSDAIMVARGDLGVELPAQRVPRIQKEIIRVCREQGRPVIVATQMLESMIEAPVPTRAEASDVATAVYDGADAVMLSAESASGAYPVEAVTMMNSIINEVELDPAAKTGRLLTGKENGRSVSDVVCRALRVAADELPLAGVVTYTRSGASSVMASRERPNAPILSVTPDLGVARRLCLAWGVRSIHSAEQLERVPDIVGNACHLARQVGLAAAGDLVAVAAGTPFGTVGSTNYLQIAKA
jgi:pyruvate kinase